MISNQPEQDQESWILHKLCFLILNILRHPPTHPTTSSFSGQFLDEASTSRQRRAETLPELTPAGLASLLLGVSLALMLCGSITFVIGFLLMPWVIGLVMLLYVVGVFSGLAMIGRAVFYHTLAPSSPRKSVSAWKLL